MPKEWSEKRNSSSKWVVKGAEADEPAEAEAAPVKPKQKAKAKPKGRPSALSDAVSAPGADTKVEEPKGPTEDEIANSPMLQEAAKATGPKYGRMDLLRFGQAEKSSSTTCKAEDGPQPEVNSMMPKGSNWKMQERPDGADEDPTRLSGGRKSVRQEQKDKKLQRRKTGDEEDLKAPETPSHRISLDSEIQGAHAANAAEGAAMGYQTSGPSIQDPFMAHYLNTMYSAAPMYPQPGYGHGVTPQTTVMLRNIPNRYTRDMLINRLNQTYAAQFDFVYLPIDFNSKCNIGYAFINFRSPVVAQRCIADFHGQKTKTVLPGFSSSKVCEVSYARVQGRDANMENLRDEKFIEKLTEQPEWQPLFYDEAGNEIPFAKTLGAFAGQRKRTRTSSGGITPGGAGGATPAGGGKGVAPSPTAGFYGQPPMYPGMDAFGMPGMPPMMWPGAQPQYPAAPVKETPLHEQKLGQLLPNVTTKTMQMLRNIPTSVTRAALIEVLEKDHKGNYDFVYMPAKEDKEDDSTEENRGYAFVNFKSGKKAAAFTAAFAGAKPKDFFGVGEDDAKPCEVADARLASIDKAIDRLRAQAAKNKDGKDKSAWFPLLFEDGASKDYPVLAYPKDSAARKEAGEGGEKDATDKKAQKEAKAKNKKKEKEESAAAAALAAGMASPSGAYGYPGYPGGAFGFPGYPGYGGGGAMPRVHPAYAHAMAQAAHFHARQAAAAHAAGAHQHQQQLQAGLLDHLAAAVNPSSPAKPLNDEQNADLKKQIEYYFSTENLCKDLYLRSHMNNAGWTPIELISQFPRVKKYKASDAAIADAMKESEVLEVDGVKKYMRLKDEALRTKWASNVPSEYRQTYKSKKKDAKDPPEADAPTAAP